MTLFEKFRTVGIPVIHIVREPGHDHFRYVSVNNEDGASKATNCLIRNGHKRVAYIMGPKTMPISLARFEGYQKALHKNRIPLDDVLTKEVDFSEKETEKAMIALMQLKSPPTAIFTFKNDITLDAIAFLKKKYPDRLNVIDFTDFGNLPLFKYLDHKPVASVEEDFYEVGRQAAVLLFEAINDKSDSDLTIKNIKIPCRLIVNR